MQRILSVVLLTTVLSIAAPPEVRAASALTPAQIHELLTAPERRVRAGDGRSAQLLAEGLRRSSTFVDLVYALHRTDVIVYIQGSADLPQALNGRMMLAVGSRGQRYVRVQIRQDRSNKELIALIGHELRHAIEIGEAPEVVDDASMIRLYERIGSRGDRLNHFDTAAARATERQVKTEL
jgi:signal transduction histidine kinase